ncbi:CBS domain-containing protein [Streptomyces nondiastaticus]|uniref:CBS domain-containing protein n=1 Tax=Streptomyces nondiastaticus TaxID=3154512 RepID=UPI00342122B5
MEHRTVGQLMTREVARVQRGTVFREIVAVLKENDVTAVPVVDAAGCPVGVVSEADLLAGGEGAGGTAATTAEALMTSPAVCARPEWSFVEAAQVMKRHHVKRLPVVDEAGRLVGIVSRGDLLSVFLRPDHAIRTEIIEDIIVRTLHEPPSAVSVEVGNGLVTLSGSLRRKSLVAVLVRLCRSVDGVVAVHEHLGFDADDTADPGE